MSEPINRKVLDLSHHNDVTSWSAMNDAGIVGIIHKATEGSSYTDDTYHDRAGDALNEGLLWGAYHFATGSDVGDQAAHFLDTVGVDGETLYCLDWEDYGDNTMSLDQAREFMEIIDKACGKNRCVLYAGNTAKEALGGNEDEFFGAHRMWLAQYGSDPVVQPSWDDYWLWQYSDGNVGPQPHGCPGVTGDVDTNSWPRTDAELWVEWSGRATPPKPPVPKPKPTIVTVRGPALVLVNGRLASGEPQSARRRPRWDIPPRG